MPKPATSTFNDDSARGVEVSGERVLLERPSRWNLVFLWDVAGFHDRRPRVARFAVTLLRPPIVSNTSPPVACELIAPPRTTLGACWLCVVGAAVAVAAAFAVFVTPIWLAAVAAPSCALAATMLIERALTYFAVPSDHLRLQDVAARHRGSGVAVGVLDELFRTVTRPVALTVDRDAAGVIALYERVGFTRTDPGDVESAEVAMTRPAPATSESDSALSVAGICPRWLWPTHTDIVLGAVAAFAMCSLHHPATWPHQVIVGTASFVVVTAAGTDWRLHRIPNALVASAALPLIWIATDTSNIGQALAGAGIMAGPLLASNLATGGRSPGLGDVKLVALAGAALGMIEPDAAPLAALMVMLLGGAAFGALYQRRTGRRGFPLGPAIAASTLVLLAFSGFLLRGSL